MNEPHSTAADDSGEILRMQQTPGTLLRKAREDAGLSHVAVGEALHLTAHYVKALESDEYGKLPGLTFVKGYLRSYARLMKVDVDAVMVSFEHYIAGLVDAGQRTEQVQRSRRRHDQALRWAIAMSVILMLGIAGGWWFKGKDDTAAASSNTSPGPASAGVRARTEPAAVSAPRIATRQAQADNIPQSALASAGIAAADATAARASASNESAASVSTAVALSDSSDLTVAPAEELALVPASGGADPQELESSEIVTVTPAEDGTRLVNLISSGDDLLELSFSGNSWVEIDDGSNARLYSDLLRTGDALTVHGTAPFVVLLGDAPNVSVRFNAEALDIDAYIRGDSTARVTIADPADTASNIQTATGVPR